MSPSGERQQGSMADEAPVAGGMPPTAEVPTPVPAQPAAGWRRLVLRLQSRWARQLGVALLVLGAIGAVGHFLGGLVGWWEAYQLTFGGNHSAPRHAEPRRPVPALSLVVLPLVNDGAGDKADWFADAVTGDLIQELGRLSGSLVIGRDTSFVYKGRRVDPRRIAEELSVKYVISGTVRRAGSQVRLAVELIDGGTGLQRWSNSVDLERAQLDATVDGVVGQIARALNVELYRSAGEGARARPREALADDLAMNGWATYFRGATAENYRDALRLFEQAVQQDPTSIRGWGGVATINAVAGPLGWLPDRAAAARRVDEASTRLQRLDADDYFAVLARSQVAAARGDWDTYLLSATALVERFPSNPNGYASRGFGLLNLGRFAESLATLEQAIRLSPKDTRLAFWEWQRAAACYMLGRFDESADHARRAQAANPGLPLAPLTLAAALAQLGRTDDARRIVAESMRRQPEFGLEQIRGIMRGSAPAYVDARERMIALLRDLGLR